MTTVIQIEDCELSETSIDTFGKSVAMQLRALSVENALLAQSKIQNILTLIGIADHKQKTASNSSVPIATSQQPSSSLSNQSCENYEYVRIVKNEFIM
jgi:hypothetical protein